MWRAGPEGLPGDLGVGQQADPCPSRPLAQQYGPAFTVHLGRQKTVVLTGYEAVREALLGTGQELAGRPPILIFQLIQGGGGPQASSSPPGRAEGPPASSPHAPSTAWAWGGRPWPTRSCRSRGASRRSCTATEFYYRDPVFVSLLGLIDKVMVLLGTPSLQLFNIYPWLRALLQLHRPVLRKVEAVRAILRTLMEARRPPAPGRGPVRSYLDALIQQGQGKDPEGLFAEANVVACALDMVMAGTETTSATLQWAALLMGKHPSVQGEPVSPFPQGPGPRGRGSPGCWRPPSCPQAGCRRSWTECWGLGGPPGWRTSDPCPTPTPCCARSSTSSPCCPTCRGARPPTPSWAATCSPRYCSPAGGGLVPGASRAQGPQPAGLPLPRHGLRHPPRTPRPLQAAVSAWGRAWPGRRCSCCSQASCSGTACCPRPASAPPPWTPRPPWPSPRGRRPRPCVRCPGCRGADHERPGLTTGQSPRAGEGLSHSRLVVLGSRASVARQHLPGRGATHLQLGMQADGRGCWAPG
ncbi:cytochrome P450 2W1 isoform X6 [Balaenoptera musculus]|uniref:Cytochrome P450 2W1 isoform X6 n=1 Tax=Balaenoptera musculus TaxID=9771 RepID=A0A8B8V6R5_BALMU|nr:cytochrome P450 2W1 isoform X6 [Balaenoptera musculus]